VVRSNTFQQITRPLWKKEKLPWSNSIVTAIRIIMWIAPHPGSCFKFQAIDSKPEKRKNGDKQRLSFSLFAPVQRLFGCAVMAFSAA